MQASPALAEAAATAAATRRSSRASLPRNRNNSGAMGDATLHSSGEPARVKDGSVGGRSPPLISGSPARPSAARDGDGGAPASAVAAAVGGLARPSPSKLAAQEPVHKLDAPMPAAADSGAAHAPLDVLPPAPVQPGHQVPLPALPPALHPSYAVNALVTRIAFDALRNPAFQVRSAAAGWHTVGMMRGWVGGHPPRGRDHVRSAQEHVRSRIQRQLSRVALPDYIQTLEVVGGEFGCAHAVRLGRAPANPACLHGAQWTWARWHQPSPM